MELQVLMGQENSRLTGARSLPTCMLAGTMGAVLLAVGCGSGSGDDAEVTLEERSIEQPAHGPIPNVHVRLVEGPNGDHVLCDGRVRGLSGDASFYSASLRITYPDNSTTTRTADVSLAAPTLVDTSDGEFRVELVETPLGSGEYTVEASLKHATTADVGTHRCRAFIEEFGVGSQTRVLHGEGQATSAATDLADPYLTATSHRQSGSHLSCQARLNHADPATDYVVQVQTNTVSGPNTRFIVADAASAVIGPLLTANGGQIVVERGTASWSSLVPSLNVRFDFIGAVGPSTCAVTVQEEVTGSTVLSETSQMSLPACTDLLAPHGGFESGPFGSFWSEFSTQFGTPICDVATCGNGGGTGPRSGVYWFWGGGTTAGPEVAYVERNVIIPVGAASLSWWMEIPSCDSTFGDFFSVGIDGATVWSTDNFDPQCNTAGYQLKSVSLDSYADGAPHTIRFESNTDSFNAATNFMVDDVTLIACQ